MSNITQWSYSRLKVFESCPKKAEYAFIQRIKEPGNKAMDRGKDIHKMRADRDWETLLIYFPF
jgi:hypothetical protein